MTESAAYSHHGQACSSEAFYALACDPQRSVVVEACAGAGKTWVLVSRILRALLDGSAPHEILAITFTKKAAGEMRERLLEWLRDFAQPRAAQPGRGQAAETQGQWMQRLENELIARGMSPQGALDKREQLQNLYQTLLAHGRPVQICTFHSWFAALLRSAPLALLGDLGLPATYELLEDDQDAIAEVWRPFLRRVVADPALQADYSALVAALGRHRTQQALTAVLNRRVEFQLADGAGHAEAAVVHFSQMDAALAGLQQPSDALASEAARLRWQGWAQALGGEKNKTPQNAANAIIDAWAMPDLDQRLAALRKALFVKDEDRLSKNLEKFPAAQAAETELAPLLRAGVQHAAWHYHHRVLRLARPLVECFAQLKRERGWVDMNDVERAALTLLADHDLSAWVQERLDARIRHLLVDEFQDTNPLQWQALHAWLSGYAGAGGGRQAPSVFIVGDPKQSIYRFRRADPQVFAAAQNFVVQALGGEHLATDHTRRNAPDVLEAVNTVLLQAQAADAFAGFRRHTTESNAPGCIEALPLIARASKTSPASAGQEGTWRDSLTQPREEAEESLRQRECQQAAQWIAGRIAAGVEPKAIMVLARKREPLGMLQAALRQRGIPCAQPEKQVLGEQPAVQDVLALVEALLSPGHDLALARALKSPLFGVSDADLACLAQAARAAGQPRPSWLDLLSKTELITHNGRALHAYLMQCREWLLALPPHDALQAIYTQRDALARFAAAAPEAERAPVLTQLRALLHAALSVQGGRYTTATQWLRALRRERLPVPHSTQAAVVRLLTVHGAKGLEADEVLLLDSCAVVSARSEPGVLLDWPGAASHPQQLVFMANTQGPPSVQALVSAEAAAQQREELNALYVAMTRARKRLVLSGVEPYRSAPGSWWDRIAPLATAVPAPEACDVPVTPPAGGPCAAELLVPILPPGPMVKAQPAIEMEAIEEGVGTDASRMGEAMHWLLEHVGESPGGWLPQRAAQLQRRFALDAAQAEHAERLARTILHGEGSWAWAREAVLEAFNEVEITHQGQRLRIDRLVRRRVSAHAPEAWWVLDYKSAAQPERDAALIAQVQRYRSALQAHMPQATVHAALLSGDGRQVVVDGAAPA